ncbi:small ribosomal subunit protein mS34 isoform X2 [Periplaneta americana]|uniref:small ribosomal subunit protein mS34 isoform X2 n=1 Tax=Periplaneta americana TaxID=6978 RepID=UPI0037E91187
MHARLNETHSIVQQDYGNSRNSKASCFHSLKEARKVRVWAEKVFRGRKYPGLVKIESASYKADYRLLHKDEEEDYCKEDAVISLEKIKLLPHTIPYPPLLKEMILNECRARGEEVTKEPEMEMSYTRSRDGLSRKARKDETPTVKFEPGIGTPISPELYANVQRQ